MKGIKPFKLGLLTRPFEALGGYRLGVSVLSFHDLAPEPTVLSEIEMWQFLPDALGPDVPIDQGIPKSRSEVIVAGSAFPPEGRATTCPVRVTIGGIDKQLYVVGDRQWNRDVPSAPLPFERMPLIWPNAFGGEGFAPNPLGKGVGAVTVDGVEVFPLPNVEYPGQMVARRKDRPVPAGFGPLDFTWPQRASKAGTYDKRWLETDYPGFARDMDWSIWNVAPQDQHQQDPFVGTEEIVARNMHPGRPELRSRLPGLRARSFVTRRTAEGERFEEVAMRLTTVWLFPDAERAISIWQGSQPTSEDDASDIVHIVVAGERLGQPRDAEHYRQVLAKRLDPENGAIASLDDGDLMPEGITGAGGGLDHIERLLTPEGVLRDNLRRNADARIESGRKMLEDLGLDPDEHGPKPLPPREPVPELARISEVVASKEREAKAAQAEGKVFQEERDEFKKQLLAELGVEWSMIEEERATVPAGPPEFSAEGKRVEMRRLADEAARNGHPSDELEFYATDEDLFAQWKKQEGQLREVYRLGAHLQGPVGRLEGDAADQVRAEVVDAVRRGVSLADRDLTGADLRELDLRGVNLTGALLEAADLEGCDLRGATLTRAVLAHANLSRANIGGARLDGANLGKARAVAITASEPADLQNANLWGANFTGAQLPHARLRAAQLWETVLEHADLSHVEGAELVFHKSRIVGARMTGANLRAAIFIEVDATELDFGGADLSEATFLDCVARRASFVNAKMSSFRLVQACELESADFRGAKLGMANLRGAKLSGADFSGANLDKADLSEATLTGAKFYRAVAREALFIKSDLEEAMMVSADLMQSILQKARIVGTDLRGANLYGADFSLVRSDARTRVEDAYQLKVRTLPRRKGS